MKSPKAKLLLHPTRIRLYSKLAGRELTARQLARRLPDVPQATLYRHLMKLAQAGVLSVVAERPVRGTVEKVYTLNAAAASLSAADLAQATPDEHLQFFMAFVAKLLGDYAHYLESPKANPAKDLVGYREVPLYLSETELAAVSKALNQAIAPALKNKPGAGRRRLILSTILMPDPEPPG
jgi:DNA-binding transcriptional ArsR family regulator